MKTIKLSESQSKRIFDSIKTIKITENQCKRLFEGDISALASDDPSEYKEYIGSETYTTNPMTDADGESMTLGNPVTTDKIANTLGDNKINRRK